MMLVYFWHVYFSPFFLIVTFQDLDSFEELILQNKKSSKYQINIIKKNCCFKLINGFLTDIYWGQRFKWLIFLNCAIKYI